VASAGTWALVESTAPGESIRLMAERGFDLSEHRARMIELDHLVGADLVLCMEQGHAEALRAEFPKHASKVHLLTEMGGKPYNVRDPYGGPREAYQEMIEEISDLIDAGLGRIIKLAEENADEGA
jgi:protein-tyrosine-phosphatase